MKLIKREVINDLTRHFEDTSGEVHFRVLLYQSKPRVFGNLRVESSRVADNLQHWWSISQTSLRGIQLDIKGCLLHETS